MSHHKPSFNGWRLVKPNEVIKRGDMYLRLGGPASQDNFSPVSTSIGETFSAVMKRYTDFYGGEYGYALYRRHDGYSAQRRLIGNRSFSIPLPLP